MRCSIWIGEIYLIFITGVNFFRVSFHDLMMTIEDLKMDTSIYHSFGGLKLCYLQDHINLSLRTISGYDFYLFNGFTLSEKRAIGQASPSLR